MPDTTLLKISYGTKAKYDAVASKVNGTLYVITDEHRLFVKLPELDAFELNSAQASVANSVAQNLVFVSTVNGGDVAGAYNGSTGSSVKTVGCKTIGALHSSQAISSVAFANEKIVISLADNTTTFETGTIKPAQATHADTAGSVGGVLTFGTKTYNGSQGQSLTLGDLLPNGKIDISYIPSTALERIYVMAQNELLYDLTDEQVQPGDLVKDSANGQMYACRPYYEGAANINRAKTLAFEPFVVGTAAKADVADGLTNGLRFNFLNNVTMTYTGGATNNQVYIGNRLTASSANDTTQNGTVTGAGGVFLNLSSQAGNTDTWGVKSSIKLVGTAPVSVTSDAGVISIGVGTMTGATAQAAGTAGLVPAPGATGNTTPYLDAYGNWTVPANTNIYHTTGTWNTGGDLLTFTAQPRGNTVDSAYNFTFTLNRASEVDPTWTDITTRSTTYGVVKGATDRSIKISDSGVISVPWMQGATDSSAGRGGLVPAPAAGQTNYFLRANGTWAVPPNDDTHYTATFVVTDAATDSTNKAGSVANGSVFMNLVEATPTNQKTITSTHKIYGNQGISVTAAVDGTRTDIIIGHTNTSVTGSGSTWGTYSATAITLNAGSSFSLPSFTYDSNGHITSASATTLQIGSVTAVAAYGAANGGQKIATVLGTDIYTGIAWGEL